MGRCSDPSKHRHTSKRHDRHETRHERRQHERQLRTLRTLRTLNPTTSPPPGAAARLAARPSWPRPPATVVESSWSRMCGAKRVCIRVKVGSRKGVYFSREKKNNHDSFQVLVLLPHECSSRTLWVPRHPQSPSRGVRPFGGLKTMFEMVDFQSEHWSQKNTGPWKSLSFLRCAKPGA